MKFQIIRQDLRFQVEKLGIRQNPDREKLLNRLTQDPPQDENNAKEIFEYLASQQACFTYSDWKKLSDFKFIPTKNEKQPLVSPCSCFLIIQDEMLKDFFSCVDFGEIANRFLSSCGVKNEPSPIDYAELLVKSSHKLWNSIGNDAESYLFILRKIAIDFKYLSTIACKSNLVAVMKKAPILVAVKKECNEINRYHLTSAENIFINDNIIYQQIFNPLTAPEEDYLEFLYKKLGCRSLHESVKETSTKKGIIRETKQSQQFQELIVERSSLFFHNYPQYVIKRDEEWVKNLKVREVDYVETSYTLEDIKHVKENSTTILQGENNLWALYITSNSNLSDISQHIVKYIYEFHDWKDISFIIVLLTTPLLSLKEMGYPVDRLLKQPNLQHIVDQMIVNQVNEENLYNSLSDTEIPITDSSEFSEFTKTNPLLYSPTDSSASYFGDYNDNVSSAKRKSVKSVITFETTCILRNSLQNAINDCYLNSENIVNSQPNTTKNANDQVNTNINRKFYNPTIKTNRIANNKTYFQNDMETIDEYQTDYCDIIPDHLLYSIGNLQGIELYLPRGFEQSELLPQENTAALNRFINMLGDLIDVFKLSSRNVHAFYDNNSNTIAFNRNRVLFFNLRFYLGLHDEECKIKPTINAMTYWFMMFCHELSHNFIEHHSSEHEYYCLAFAEIYMPNLLAIVRRREIYW
ncbi:hypothetical protein RclHR1_00010044 [Rhizophagus clarus]|uniref:HATPase_c domain-containing protein n=1 Tax=Rhizophagus clarus TaxID=94130 RepID=A0A2Z6Q4U0_9GLOM|nr:hypothetical protein RclHR1_00010044 [Rhizophagus clarus]GES75161.1 HATPase_c domain-containing protein [Rhizophagus clarus]